MSQDGEARYEELLSRLTLLAARLDPVPGHVVEAAKASRTWQTIDAELAELVYDSVQSDELAGVRGSGDARQLTFEAPGVTVEVEIGTVSRRLQGQLVPPQEADVEVRHPGGAVTVRSDELGHFSCEGVPRGPVSLRCRVAGRAGPTAHTDWVVL